MFEATKIIHQNSDWITFVLLFVFMILVVLKLVFRERLFRISTFFFSKKYLSIYFNKEKKMFFNLFQGSLFIVQLLVLSLLFYVANTYFQMYPKQLNFNSFFLLFSGFIIYFSLRYFLGLLLAYLFNFKNEFSKIVYHKMSYFNNLILWLLPFLVLSVYFTEYKKIVLEITFVVFALLLILRYSLVLRNNKKLIFSNLFYFILYICALEIAPLIIILKLTI
ncbi:DUF4271 domain-containing protein [Lutibacter sp.]|uniref:DUF4271 domain-containing protein n=1 Tax=Lutibacter sp. TaxID=1925666 RepID=UPI0038CDB9F1